MGDTELERFKTEINLAELASAYGYELVKRESSRSSFVMSHQDGNKIVVATGMDGHSTFFSVHDDRQHGSVIDFVMHQEEINLGHARQILRKWLANPDVFFSEIQKRQLLRPEPIPHNCTAIHIEWLKMRPYQSHSTGYLEERGLNAKTIAAFAERIRVDKRSNVTFRHDDSHSVSGWEIKNRGFQGFVGGGRKALFGCKIGSPHKERFPLLVITESAIDAMSYYQLQPATGFYLSFAGSLSPEQHNLLKYVLNRYLDAKIVAATDNDPQGEEFARIIRSFRPNVIRTIPPIGKDWNDTLKATMPINAMRSS